MTIADYYRALDLKTGCSAEDIKKAYRKKAREYHPDLNHTPGAMDMFILVTEAYEFLISYNEKLKKDAEAFDKAMDDWRKYRHRKAHHRARAYSRTSYVRFRNTKFYKSTQIFDGTTVIFSTIISLLVITIAVTGYFYRIHHPIPGIENPTVSILLGFIVLGLILFVISMIYLKAYLQTYRKNKRRE